MTQSLPSASQQNVSNHLTTDTVGERERRDREADERFPTHACLPSVGPGQVLADIIGSGGGHDGVPAVFRRDFQCSIYL
jgi:hypothetical protein